MLKRKVAIGETFDYRDRRTGRIVASVTVIGIERGAVRLGIELAEPDESGATGLDSPESLAQTSPAHSG